MAACGICGVNIRWAETTEGKRVKLERIPSPAGPNRYQDITFGAVSKVQSVTETASCLAYPEHICGRSPS